MAMLNNQRVHYQFPVLPCIKISCTQSPLRHLKTDICGMTIAVNGGAWPQYLLPHSKTLQKGLYVVLATRIIWLFAGVSEEAHAKPTSCSTKLMPSSAYGSFNISSHQLPGGLWALGQTLFPWRFDAVTAKLILPCPAMPCHALPCPAMPCHALPAGTKTNLESLDFAALNANLASDSCYTRNGFHFACQPHQRQRPGLPVAVW